MKICGARVPAKEKSSDEAGNLQEWSGTADLNFGYVGRAHCSFLPLSDSKDSGGGADTSPTPILNAFFSGAMGAQ